MLMHGPVTTTVGGGVGAAFVFRLVSGVSVTFATADSSGRGPGAGRGLRLGRGTPGTGALAARIPGAAGRRNRVTLVFPIRRPRSLPRGEEKTNWPWRLSL